MATDELQAPDGFADAAPEPTTDEPTIELSPGETLHGIVLETREGDGNYGPWCQLRIKDRDRDQTVKYFAKDEAKRAFFGGNLEEGDDVWIAKSTEERDLSTGGTYHPTLCKVKEDN